MTRRRYTIVIEKSPKSYGAFVPDIPACGAVAKTQPTVLKLIREAIGLHLQDLRAQGRSLPRPTAVAESVEVAV
jgi:predicted RNase H-like HicB family nuclease